MTNDPDGLIIASLHGFVAHWSPSNEEPGYVVDLRRGTGDVLTCFVSFDHDEGGYCGVIQTLAGTQAIQGLVTSSDKRAAMVQIMSAVSELDSMALYRYGVGANV